MYIPKLLDRTKMDYILFYQICHIILELISVCNDWDLTDYIFFFLNQCLLFRIDFKIRLIWYVAFSN